MTKLNNLKYHHNYAKQYGDTDIQVSYLNKITDYFAQELYGEFGYDTCSNDEKFIVMSETIKLLQND
tara:strand:- start:1384 stop:1584 length:201 start_codon:yes stop_codon:yes gene_type:complete